MKALVDFANTTLGKAKGDLLSNVLVSLMWKLNMSRYHADESKEAIKKMLGNPKEVDPAEIVDLIFEQAGGSEKGNEFFKMQFASEAHLIACAQSLHSMGDIFGQVVYLSLDLDNVLPKPIPARRQYLGVINDSLKNEGVAPRITEKIEELLISDEYCYLNDFVNVTKHISLVPARYSVAFGQEAVHGLQISRFSRNGNNYDTKWSDDFLDKDVINIQKKFVEAGVVVNEYLGIQA